MIIVVCSALITKDDTVLLVHETKMDKYGLPGGKLESGESLHEAVTRECREEIGAVIAIDGLITIVEKPKSHEGNTVIRFTYRAHIIEQVGEAELEHQYYDQAAISHFIEDGVIRGQDVVELLQRFFMEDIPVITDAVVFA